MLRINTLWPRDTIRQHTRCSLEARCYRRRRCSGAFATCVRPALSTCPFSSHSKWDVLWIMGVAPPPPSQSRMLPPRGRRATLGNVHAFTLRTHSLFLCLYLFFIPSYFLSQFLSHVRITENYSPSPPMNQVKTSSWSAEPDQVIKAKYFFFLPLSEKKYLGRFPRNSTKNDSLSMKLISFVPLMCLAVWALAKCWVHSWLHFQDTCRHLNKLGPSRMIPVQPGSRLQQRHK